MRILIAGDVHGRTKPMIDLCNEAGRRKITHLFVVGDFGLWTHMSEGVEFLDAANAAAEENGLTIFAIGGNHEHWDHWNWFVENMPSHKGFGMARRRVLLSPKAHHFKLANKQFVVAGGAVSIDKAWRQAKERGGSWNDREWGINSDLGRGSGPKTLWWPNEELTDEDVNTIKSWRIKADILLTHDASDRTPWLARLKPDHDSVIHRRRIDRVLEATHPEFHFHGHFHEKYDWTNYTGELDGQFHYAKTYGLECDGMHYNWGVFDTETNEFAFRGEGMNFRSLDS